VWFAEVRIPVGGGKPRVQPVLVMVSSHSRFIMARMLQSRMTGNLLAGMWELLGSLGAVPRRLIWDNEAGIGRRNGYAAGMAAFAGACHQDRAVQALRPGEQGRGGAGEPVFGDLLSARPDLTAPEDFNAQLGQWLPVANARLVRRTGAKPAE
jgi:hypothetical protein